MDIRNGYDNKIYDSAGNAVRGQISSLVQNCIGKNVIGGVKGINADFLDTTIGFSAKSADNINHSCAIGVGARATKSNQVVIGSCSSTTWKPTETVLNGDIIVCDSNNIYRKLVFNQDNSVSWTDVTAQYS